MISRLSLRCHNRAHPTPNQSLTIAATVSWHDFQELLKTQCRHGPVHVIGLFPVQTPGFWALLMSVSSTGWRCPLSKPLSRGEKGFKAWCCRWQGAGT